MTAIYPSPVAHPISTPPSDKLARAPTPNGQGQLVGLFELEAKDAIFDPLLPTYHLDVIALHGLNGNAFKTWTNKHNQLWLRDLPYSLPGARVYTFGYNSALFGHSKADIGDFARRLLSELSLIRQSEVVCDSWFVKFPAFEAYVS